MNDPEPALRSLLTAPDEMRQPLIAALENGVPSTDPEAVIEALLAIDSPTLQPLIAPTYRNFALQSPEKAIASAQSLPDDLRTEALHTAAEGWMFNEPLKAGAWIVEHKEDVDARQLIKRVARHSAGRDLDATNDWVKSITDAGLRKSAEEGIALATPLISR